MTELSTPEKMGFLEQIARMAVKSDVTLLYAARDEEYNNARVLAEVISRLMRSLPQT